MDFNSKFNYQRFFSKRVEFEENSYEIIRQFESDRGRIINSAAIRRLQQKTQVFPLERNAAVRSRLTHSLEVQQVGRYISKEILHNLGSQKRDELGLAGNEEPFVSIVEMACLLHDVGNPPFGHFGEAALNDWFCGYLGVEAKGQLNNEEKCLAPCLRLSKTSPKELNELRTKMRIDLSHFEGNAQGIRLVHSLLKLNLTYAQIACVLKYTRPAYWQGDLPGGFRYLMKKPGYYLSEDSFIQRLRQELKMEEFHRFPLSYIMEAADDISYCVADLEDAVEKKILTVEQLLGYLANEWGVENAEDLFATTVKEADSQYQEKYVPGRTDNLFFMSLRVNVISKLVPYVAQRFIDCLPQIYAGCFNQALLESADQENRLLNMFKKVARQYVFNHPEVEQLELQGYRVIRGLLDIYSSLLKMSMEDFSQLVKHDAHRDYPIETRLFHKLSAKHRVAYQEAVNASLKSTTEESIIWEYYYRVRLLQDYISGMTDLYAYDEYRKLMAAE